jgi:HD-GYP domain-containing protein (c-di-GMP phosphodiesterase class II)
VEVHEPYDILHRLCMPDGRVKYVNERCQTFYDGHGKPLRSIGTIIDVTERWQSQQKLDAVLTSTIQAMATALDKRDPYTSGHQQRVAALAEGMGKQLGLENEQIQGLHLGAVIHNLGNLYVPMEILNRPGPLNDHEYAIVKSHPEVGYEIVKDIDFPWPVAEMVHQHHERLDGSGYPQGLSGESIILEARILAVADVVVAMTTHRPYRPARPLEQAMAELENGRGRLYDPAVVEACLAVLLNDDYQADLL